MDENNINDREPEQLRDPLDRTELQPDEVDISLIGLDPSDKMDVDDLIQEAKLYTEMPPLGTRSEDPEEQPPEARSQEISDQEAQSQCATEEHTTVHPLETESNFKVMPEKVPHYGDEEAEDEAEEISMRKGRPKRTDRYGMLGIPHILVTCFWLIIVLAIGVSMGRVIWVCASEVLAFGREEKIVNVVVDNDDTLDEIAEKLYRSGLIRYPGLFKLYAGFTDARESIGSGNFELNTLYDYHALVDSLNGYSSQEEVEILIPEGYSCGQIFELLEEKGVCSAEELENYAKDGELEAYWFLEGVRRGDKYCLEGFLFPDTYEFYTNSSARRVLEKLLDNFDHRFDEEMRNTVDALNEKLAARMSANGHDEAYIQEHKLSLRDVVTVASLIEKETAGKDESANIASVIYNRLTNQDSWPYLNIDAALLYAIGHREVISAEDKEADTPYNTYLYTGLIPGPIANPGLNSLKAALNPNDTPYYCYALDPATGAHHFSETLEEHNAFLEGLGGE